MGIGPANLNSRNMLARLSKSKYYQLVKPMARSINMARSIKETTRPHPGILQEAPDRRGQGAPCCSRAEGALDPASDSLAEMTATYPLANSRAARNATADPHIKSRMARVPRVGRPVVFEAREDKSVLAVCSAQYSVSRTTFPSRNSIILMILCERQF
jgi:hypothetical protein